jgi:hypothetical protein
MHKTTALAQNAQAAEWQMKTAQDHAIFAMVVQYLAAGVMAKQKKRVASVLEMEP